MKANESVEKKPAYISVMANQWNKRPVPGNFGNVIAIPLLAESELDDVILTNQRFDGCGSKYCNKTV